MDIDAVREAVRAWREARCARACPACPVNCCEGRLNPRLDRLDAFADLPVVAGPLDPRPLDGPYVLDRRFLRWGACYLAGRCPHLDGERRCDIYGQAVRPLECREYPLHLQRVLGGHVLSVERSCWIFRDDAAVDEVRALARDLKVELRLHGSPVE